MQCDRPSLNISAITSVAHQLILTECFELSTKKIDYLQQMDRFTISDIESLSGIKAHTLRIWEKRYGLFTPKRKESNHRYYDNEDLKYILQVAYLYHHGHKISRITTYDKAELKKFTAETITHAGSQMLFVNNLLNAALDFNEELFDEVISTSIERLGFEQSIINVVYPYFEKIGLLWMNNDVTPAHEHFSTNIIRSKIIVAIDKIKNPVSLADSTILLFTPEGEHHEIPLLFEHYLFKKYNKQVTYAGSNVSVNTIQTICAAKKIDSILFHLITNFIKCPVDSFLSELCRRLPAQQIIMSGPLTNCVSISLPNCRLLKSFEEALEFIKN